MSKKTLASLDKGDLKPFMMQMQRKFGSKEMREAQKIFKKVLKMGKGKNKNKKKKK